VKSVRGGSAHSIVKGVVTTRRLSLTINRR
jgi:hypothetical protein